MYENSYGEIVKVDVSSYSLSSVDTKTYGEINKIINPFDLNITKNNPYKIDDKNKCCFLEITTELERILVILKTDEIPNFTYYYELSYDHINDKYPDLFAEGILNFSLTNNDNQLVLMYGISIIILDIDTFEVIKYNSTDKIKKFGIKLTYENNIYNVKDELNNITKFDKDLNVIN